MRHMSIYQLIIYCMKKVRRRIVERDGQDPNDEQIDSQVSPILVFETSKAQKLADGPKQATQYNQERVTERITHGKRSQILIPQTQNQSKINESTSSFQNKVREDKALLSISQKKSGYQTSNILLSHSSQVNKPSELKSGEDERKNRIEMLKQKYLKKNTEIKIQISKPTQTLKARIIQQSKQLEIIPKQVNLEDQTEKNIVVPVKYEQKQPIFAPKPTKIMILPEVNEAPAQPTQFFKKQPITKQIKQTQQSLTPHLPQRVEDKKPFKVPPPPPNKNNMHKTKPPPPPVSRSYENQEQEVFVKEHPIENKVYIQPDKASENAEKQKEVVRPTFIPPPPPIKNTKQAVKPPNVQEILSKKAKKDESKIAIDDQFKKQNLIQEPINIVQKQEFPSSKSTGVQKQIKNSLASLEKPIQNSIADNGRVAQKRMLSVSEQIYSWINSPQTILSNFISNIDQIIHASADSSDKYFNFRSQNPSFNSSINGFINQFVLKSKNGLSEGQKSASYTLSLEYFNSNAVKLSAQLLLVLIKLGGTYMDKYSAHIASNLEENSNIVLLHKYFFTGNQLSTFVNVVIDQKQISQSQLIYLLLIYPNEKVISILNSKLYNNLQYIISLLSCIQLVRKQFPILTNSYLKLISFLIENIPEDQSLVELILKHLNELQTNEKSYQIHKQLKLKLIGLLSNSQKTQKQEIKMITPEPVKESGDGGLLGYWNKAVDKIKTATTQFAELKPEKPTPVQQEEEKEEEIIYDPILKRYLINGKVPEDDSSRPVDPTASKLPPPPPPAKNANRPAPPPLPGKKGRIATNRYA